MNSRQIIYRRFITLSQRFAMSGKHERSKPNCPLISISVVRKLTNQQHVTLAPISTTEQIESNNYDLTPNNVDVCFKNLIRNYLYNKCGFAEKYLAGDVIEHYVGVSNRRSPGKIVPFDVDLNETGQTFEVFIMKLNEFLGDVRVNLSKSKLTYDDMRLLLSFALILPDLETADYSVQVINDVVHELTDSNDVVHELTDASSSKDIFDVHVLLLMNFYLRGDYYNALKLCGIILGSKEQPYAMHLPRVLNKHNVHLMLQLFQKTESHYDNALIDILASNLPPDVTPNSIDKLFTLLFKDGNFEDCLSLSEFINTAKVWNCLLNLKGSNQELATLYINILEQSSAQEITFNQGYKFRGRLLNKMFQVADNLKGHPDLKKHLFSVLLEAYRHYHVDNNKDFESLFYSAIEM